jgi:hypothetical protein
VEVTCAHADTVGVRWLEVQSNAMLLVKLQGADRYLRLILLLFH